MPKVTVYVRNEDIEEWRSIGAKTTFIHNALKAVREGGLESLGLIVDDRTQVTYIDKPLVKAKGFIKTPEQAVEAVKQVFGKEVATYCPNGHAIPEGRSKCLGRGCKYS